MADDLYELEYLSLVNMIAQEIGDRVGNMDKVVAKFIIMLHDQSNNSLSDFKAKLEKSSASFPDSLIESVDGLILNMHPKYKKEAE
ncbi:hypothetical protein M413DRAFT_439151 [Hebeloma cylindrosporum]|uniref:Uncharacterized protein n=1 Tax=Hebeloma cylindrosporum TaxID=76867 RepID=A0A0C3CTR1_HEBCY|nr:hypothetical protein M413DRAFT_439151 [Hebeloma cylindrosporum h7]